MVTDLDWALRLRVLPTAAEPPKSFDCAISCAGPEKDHHAEKVLCMHVKQLKKSSPILRKQPD